VGLPIPFSGGLLVCRERVKELSTGIGPELAWRFKRIRELIFEKSKLTHSYDHSDAIAKIRDEITADNGDIPVSVGEGESDAYARYKASKLKLTVASDSITDNMMLRLAAMTLCCVSKQLDHCSQVGFGIGINRS